MANLPEGSGTVLSYSGADPAAGVDATITCPPATRWLILAASITIVTDATVADRYLRLLAFNGGLTVVYAIATLAIPANTTRSNVWFPTAQQFTAAIGGITNAPLPPRLLLAAGDALTVSPTAMQIGDNLTALTISVEEWIEP